MMKILELKAHNFKRLRAVEIVPGSGVVSITGRNASGKSSVLDAILAALGGGKSLPLKPIRDGESSSVVRVTLGEKSAELIVTRKFSASGTSTLTVESPDRAKFPSPQAMLDALLGQIAFDPLAFARQDPRKQVETLKSLVSLDIDPDAIDAEIRELYTRRTDENRELKQFVSLAQAMGLPDDDKLPDVPVDVREIKARIADAEKLNAARAKRIRDAEIAEIKARDLALRADACREEAARLRKQADKLCEEAENNDRTSADSLAIVEEMRRDIPAEISLAELSEELERAHNHNRLAERRLERVAYYKQAEERKNNIESLTARMQELEQMKTDAIKSAKMPVPGLGFSGGIVTLGGIPLSQASSAEQLRTSVAIAMAANPRLRVIHIRDGSLLDEDSLRIVQDMATDGDYQVWIERVDTSGRVGIVMEDGEVLATTPVAALDA